MVYKNIKLLIIIIIAMCFQSRAEDQAIRYAYYTHAGDESVIHILNMNNKIVEEKKVPNLRFYSLTNVTGHLAFSTPEGDISIINMDTLEIIHLPVRLLDSWGYFYDTQTMNSRSLMWSPDGLTLAFIGWHDTNADIYIYNLISRELLNLTQQINFMDKEVDIVSWSPNNAWLTVLGRWNNSSTSQLQIALVSVDETSIIEADLEHPVCRLQWSPSLDYMATTHDCRARYESYDSDLFLVTVDLSAQTISMETISDIDPDDRLEDYHYYRAYPTWIDSGTLAYVRYTVPRTLETHHAKTEFLYLSVASRDISTWTHAPQTMWHSALGEWLITQDATNKFTPVFGLNLASKENFYLPAPEGDSFCPSSYIRLSNSADVLALMGGCSAQQPSPSIYFFRIGTGELLFHWEVEEEFFPIGFID